MILLPGRGSLCLVEPEVVYYRLRRSA